MNTKWKFGLIVYHPNKRVKCLIVGFKNTKQAEMIGRHRAYTKQSIGKRFYITTNTDYSCYDMHVIITQKQIKQELKIDFEL